MTDVSMPKLADSMESGTIARWLIGDGQPVSVGDDLVEIETDKAVVVHPAELEGILHVLVEEGAQCLVGTVIAEIGPVAAEVSPSVTGGEEVAPSAPVQTLVPPPAPRSPRVAASTDERLETGVTPLARRAATLHGISLNSLVGSGPRGRILRRDVLSAAGVVPDPEEERPVRPASAAKPQPVVPRPAGDHGTDLVPLTHVQRLIADRMARAKSTIPEFQVQTEVRANDLLSLHESLRRDCPAELAPSLNDLVIKAAAITLREHPLVNGSFTDSGYELHHEINVGFAVAIPGALYVPVLRDADITGLGAMAIESKRLIQQARAGHLTPAELSGGTFTVSNLGMFGVTAMTPIINHPQAAILGVGGARETLALVEGVPAVESLMTLTLICDHRIIYGAEAAEFLSKVKRKLESPTSLLL
jgi:pyruvate dehydrogenase E2 component (dihydrolipoamide acetyltransferase)